MSASDNLSSTQFAVHRGINAVDSRQWEEWTGEKGGFRLDKNNLGSHWSKDASVPKRFAYNPGSAIFHGTVSANHVITDKGEQVRIGADDIRGEYADEKEVPIRRGSPVNIHRVDKVKETRTRTRTYNPPRQLKA